MSDQFLNFIFKLKWLKKIFILNLFFVFGFFVSAEVMLLNNEQETSKIFYDPKQSLETTSSTVKATAAPVIINPQPVNTEAKNNFVNKPPVTTAKNCFKLKFKSLLNENREQLRKIQLEYKNLRYMNTSTLKKNELFSEYKTKVKNLRQDFLLKAKKIKEECQ